MSAEWEMGQIPCISPIKEATSMCLPMTFWIFFSNNAIKQKFWNSPSLHKLQSLESGVKPLLNKLLRIFEKGVLASFLFQRHLWFSCQFLQKWTRLWVSKRIVICEVIGAASEDKKCKIFCTVLGIGYPWGMGRERSMADLRGTVSRTPEAQETLKQAKVNLFQNYLGNKVETMT